MNNINVEKFISRQDLSTLYCTSGALYARKYSLLKKFKEKDFNLGKKFYGIVIDDFESVNIDRMIDLEFAEYLSKKNLKKFYLIDFNPSIFNITSINFYKAKLILNIMDTNIFRI